MTAPSPFLATPPEGWPEDPQVVYDRVVSVQRRLRGLHLIGPRDRILAEVQTCADILGDAALGYSPFVKQAQAERAKAEQLRAETEAARATIGDLAVIAQQRDPGHRQTTHRVDFNRPLSRAEWVAWLEAHGWLGYHPNGYGPVGYDVKDNRGTYTHFNSAD